MLPVRSNAKPVANRLNQLIRILPLKTARRQAISTGEKFQNRTTKLFPHPHNLYPAAK
jgi:hypothetical protein